MIPARFSSTRYPGKPLVDICGKTMIQHVWEKCKEVSNEIPVFVVTDSERIRKVVEEFGGQVVMTSSDCLTGTDRLAEAVEKLSFDYIINVQGDEPLIDPSDIKAVIEAHKREKCIVNAMTSIRCEQEFNSLTIPKVVFDNNNNLLYMSRSPIPGNKDGCFINAYKQVCIYAFSKEDLLFFKSRTSKTSLEELEDIEILRFLENGFKVKMVELSTGSVAVDTPEDRKRVEEILLKIRE